jgi:hypothetical protein
MSAKMSTKKSLSIPVVKFDSKITAIVPRLTAAFENLKLRAETYGISPDDGFVFKQDSFDEFVRKVCEEHYGRIYTKKGISKTFRDKVKGDFLHAIISALGKSSSERLKLLVTELKKFA